MDVIHKIDTYKPYRFLVFAEETGQLTVIPEDAEVLNSKPWLFAKRLPSYKTVQSHSKPSGNKFTLTWVEADPCFPDDITNEVNAVLQSIHWTGMPCSIGEHPINTVRLNRPVASIET